jgi:hypothetical protein
MALLENLCIRTVQRDHMGQDGAYIPPSRPLPTGYDVFKMYSSLPFGP